MTSFPSSKAIPVGPTGRDLPEQPLVLCTSTAQQWLCLQYWASCRQSHVRIGFMVQSTWCVHYEACLRIQCWFVGVPKSMRLIGLLRWGTSLPLRSLIEPARNNAWLNVLIKFQGWQPMPFDGFHFFCQILELMLLLQEEYFLTEYVPLKTLASWWPLQGSSKHNLVLQDLFFPSNTMPRGFFPLLDYVCCSIW